jgi:alpha-L-rhamnosidase
MNHIMFGEIGAWMYKALGGIKPDASKPGFKNVVLQPYFVKGLEHFNASHTGPYGKIVSDWKRTGAGILYTVVVPPNSRATVKLVVEENKQWFKDGKLLPGIKGNCISTLQAGSYQLELK